MRWWTLVLRQTIFCIFMICERLSHYRSESGLHGEPEIWHDIERQLDAFHHGPEHYDIFSRNAMVFMFRFLMYTMQISYLSHGRKIVRSPMIAPEIHEVERQLDEFHQGPELKRTDDTNVNVLWPCRMWREQNIILLLVRNISPWWWSTSINPYPWRTAHVHCEIAKTMWVYPSLGQSGAGRCKNKWRGRLPRIWIDLMLPLPLSNRDPDATARGAARSDL